MTLDPTTLLGRSLGPYTLERLLGGGAFAWVYAAHRQGWPGVALKVLKPRYAGDAFFESRFRQEAETAAQLRHAHVVRILDVGQAEGFTFFCMDLHPDTLDARLEREGPLDEPSVARLGAEVAAALGFAHERGIVHRDVNGHNILLRADGTAVIADFGIANPASLARGHPRVTMTVGTPQYMSPEHARGLPLDGRSDQYSLGVTLYKAATGATPFQATDWFELARMHVEDRPPKPRSLRRDLSPRFERVILRCLAKEPQHRYPSAAALRQELRRLAAPRSHAAAPWRWPWSR